MKTETVHIMDYDELDKLVNTTFPGLNFEFVSQEEMGNDSDKYFGLITDPPTYAWQRKEVVEFIAAPGEARFTTWILLFALVAKGLLPAGNYLIRVSW